MLGYTTYKGWNALSLSNDLVEGHVVPALGGRLMQFTLQGFDFLFVNSTLESLYPERLPDKKWMNFGGEKVWPAPQGWGGGGYWPGPPDHILDEGIYEYSTTQNSITLVSPPDIRTGLQIKRQLTMEQDEASIRIIATFVNKSDRDIRWSIWPVCQVAVDGQDENQCQVVCPMKKEAKYNSQYKIIHGLVNNPQYKCDESDNLVITYNYIVGKVGTDSDKGWIAYVNKGKGKVLVMSFDVEDGADYPDNTTIQVWTQGEGATYSRGRVNIHKSDRIANPPYMELEILSPIVKLTPEESYSFSYSISACTIEIGMSVSSVFKHGVTVSPVHSHPIHGGSRIKGAFGFFNKGVLQVILENKTEDKRNREAVLLETEVSPLVCTVIDIPVDTSWDMGEEEMALSLRLNNYNGEFLEEIDKIIIGK